MKRIFLPVGLAAVLCATSALATHDHFNRATLGPPWVIPSGSLFINNNQLQGATGSLGYLMRSSSDTTVRATVFTTGTDLEYGAVASGNIAGGNNAFVKIQAQTATGNFSNGAFYMGNNSGSEFFALTSEVPSPARLLVSFCGTVATMTIESSAPTQVYNFDYGTTFGAGGGLGTFGSVALDNYRSTTAGCSFSRRGTWIKHGSNVRDLSLSK